MRKCIFFLIILCVVASTAPSYAGMTADATHVYCNSIVVPGPDPKNFVVLGSGSNYGKDANNVYSCFGDLNHPISGADVTSFVELSEMYAKDDHKVFCGREAIAEADPQSFEILEYPVGYGPLDRFYAKDWKRVFYQGAPINGADPKTFRIMTGSISADKDHVYYFRSVIVFR